MRLFLAILLTCSLARAAVQDDLARAFLLNVLANNAVPVLTNLVVPPLTNATVLVVTNIARQAGASSSNAVVGGVIYVDPLSHTNLNGTGTLTNLAAISIPALTLLNIGDAIRCEWGGKMPVAAGTNQFTIVYGATTILDTGLQAASNRVFKATAVITRTGASAQHVEAYFSWGERNAPLGTLFSQTNVNISMTENNAVVGGVIYVDPLSHTNLNGTGTLTNLAAISIPPLTLLNIGDAIRCEWGGKMPVAAGTNQFTIVYGATTILDTGLQAASNRVFKATAVITRTGASAQHVEAYFSWGERNAPLGTLFSQTNVNISMTENNAVANVLALRGAARRVGGHTNNSFRVFWEGIK